MDLSGLWLLPPAILFSVAATLLTVRWLSREKQPKTPRKRAGREALHFECSICRRDLVFSPAEMVRLSPVEIALVVRSSPGLVGSKLAEYVCPYCQAAHCFVVDAGPPQWVGVNFYEPQDTAARCSECRKPVQTPPWPPGLYDGRPLEAPSLLPDYGLVCDRCGAVCCFACCEKNTRHRTEDGSLVCPRCFRSPVDRFYRP